MRQTTNCKLRTSIVSIATAISLVTLAEPAFAGPLEEAAKQAEQLAASGDPAKAMQTIRDAMADFSQTLPLTIGKAVFVSETPVGYGIYNPRATSTFKVSEPVVSYVEPIGLAWQKPDADGRSLAKFTVDLAILDRKQKVLGTQENFGAFSFNGFGRNQEVYTHLTLDVTAVPPGDYIVRYTFKDQISGQSAFVDQPVTLVAE